MNTENVDYAEVVATFSRLSDYLDAIEERLRVYDTALRFAEANYPREAETFKFCMATSQLEELKNSASLEHRLLFEKLREIVARVFQASATRPAQENK